MKKTSTAVVFVGPSMSGKSTLTKKLIDSFHYEFNFVELNRNSVREELGFIDFNHPDPWGEYMKHNKETKAAMEALVSKVLQRRMEYAVRKCFIVIDSNTNVNEKFFRKNIEKYLENFYRVLIVHIKSFSREEDKRHAPVEVREKMHRSAMNIVNNLKEKPIKRTKLIELDSCFEFGKLHKEFTEFLDWF
jgi:predicted kinase